MAPSSDKIPRARGLAAALAVVLVALSGCGGGDEEGGSAAADVDLPAPSKRDYIVQADTICAQAEQGLQTEAEIAFGIGASDFTVAPSGKIIFKPGRRPANAEIRAFGEDVVIPRLREQLAELRALTPPAGDERRIAVVYDTAETGIDELAADPARFNDEGSVARALSRARGAARSYGFFDCGTYSGP
jgi:hypothetical protein